SPGYGHEWRWMLPQLPVLRFASRHIGRELRYLGVLAERRGSGAAAAAAEHSDREERYEQRPACDHGANLWWTGGGTQDRPPRPPAATDCPLAACLRRGHPARLRAARRGAGVRPPPPGPSRTRRRGDDPGGRRHTRPPRLAPASARPPLP